MAANSILQNVYYHFSLSDPMIAMKIDPEFFSSKVLQNAFKLAKDYVTKYHVAPSLQQMKELVFINNMQEQIPDDLLDILYAQASTMNNYTQEWLFDQVTNWAILENMKKAIVSAAAYMKLNQDSAENGNAKETVERIKNIFNQSSILEFEEEQTIGSDFWMAETHKKVATKPKYPCGFPYIDLVLNGGFESATLNVIVGAPKAGKSMVLQNLAAAAVLHGYNSVYISLELSEEMITARIGSNLFNIDSLQYSKYADDEFSFRDRINQFRKSQLIKPGELIIKSFPTSTLTTIDLEAYLLKVQEETGIKIRFLFLDYLNIMSNWRNPNSENTYLKIKQLSEDVRALSKRLDLCTVTASQLNRSAAESSDVNVSQVSESYGLNSTVDSMFAIIADPLMVAQGKMYLKDLYTRFSGMSNTKKLYNCDMNHLRITEDSSEGIIDTALVNPIQTQQKFIKGAAEMRSKNQQQFQPGALERPDAPEPTTFVPSTNLVDSSASPMPNTFSSPLFNVKGAGLFDNKPQQ